MRFYNIFCVSTGKTLARRVELSLSAIQHCQAQNPEGYFEARECPGLEDLGNILVFAERVK